MTGVYVTRNWRGKWVVRLEGQYDTQLQAELVGRSVSRLLNAEFTVRDRLGRFRKKDSHGGDPPDVPG